MLRSPASLSWCQAPIWDPRPDFYYCKFGVCWCEAPSLKRGRVCRLQLLLALSRAVILGSQSRWTREHILLAHFRDSPQPGEPGPRFYNPQEQGDPCRRLLQLADYGGSIRARLHTGVYNINRPSLLWRHRVFFVRYELNFKILFI
jgi:hypothetical protein